MSAYCVAWDPFVVEEPSKNAATLPMDQMGELFNMYDYDTNVKTAAGIRLDALLAGSVLFLRQDEELDATATRWYSHVYSQLCRQIVRSLWAVGFAAIVIRPHKLYIGEPAVLDLMQLEVEYELGIDNAPKFAFYPLRGVETDADRHPIPGVTVFYQVDQLPLVTYREAVSFRSLLASLARDNGLENALRSAQITASARQARPTAVVARPIENVDVNNLSDQLHPLATHEGDGNTPADELQSMTIANHNDREVAKRAYATSLLFDMCQQLNVTSVAGLNKIDKSQLLRAMQSAGPAVQQLRLQVGEVLAGQINTEGPGDLLLNVMALRTERIWLTLGVPPSLLTQKNALGASTQVSESALMLFENAQRQLKTLLIHALHVVYDRVYRVHHQMYYLSKVLAKGSKQKPTYEGLEAASNVEIQLPGLPSDTTVTELYQLGVLKYEAFCHFLQQKHGFLPSAFNEKPLIDVEDLALGREKEVATGSSKPKKKAKR
jgi:hypothetical protein